MKKIWSLASYSLILAVAMAQTEPRFLLHEIARDLSEGVSVFDVNRDGRLDVVSGAFWYQAPDWKPHRFREVGFTNEYVINCVNFTRHTLAMNSPASPGMQLIVKDLDADGDFDIITAAKSGQYWFENLTINKVPDASRETFYQRFPTRK